MKRPWCLSALLGVVTSLPALPAIAQPTHCEFAGYTFEIGEKFFSREPALVNELTEILIDRGIAPQHAKEIALTDDWVGYTLRCSAQMQMSADGHLSAGSPVMVLSETHEDHFYQLTQTE